MEATGSEYFLLCSEKFAPGRQTGLSGQSKVVSYLQLVPSCGGLEQIVLQEIWKLIQSQAMLLGMRLSFCKSNP